MKLFLLKTHKWRQSDGQTQDDFSDIDEGNQDETIFIFPINLAQIYFIKKCHFDFPPSVFNWKKTLFKVLLLINTHWYYVYEEIAKWLKLSQILSLFTQHTRKHKHTATDADFSTQTASQEAAKPSDKMKFLSFQIYLSFWAKLPGKTWSLSWRHFPGGNGKLYSCSIKSITTGQTHTNPIRNEIHHRRTQATQPLDSSHYSSDAPPTPTLYADTNWNIWEIWNRRLTSHNLF